MLILATAEGRIILSDKSWVYSYSPYFRISHSSLKTTSTTKNTACLPLTNFVFILVDFTRGVILIQQFIWLVDKLLIRFLKAGEVNWLQSQPHSSLFIFFVFVRNQKPDQHGEYERTATPDEHFKQTKVRAWFFRRKEVCSSLWFLDWRFGIQNRCQIKTFASKSSAFESIIVDGRLFWKMVNRRKQTCCPFLSKNLLRLINNLIGFQFQCASVFTVKQIILN